MKKRITAVGIVALSLFLCFWLLHDSEVGAKLPDSSPTSTETSNSLEHSKAFVTVSFQGLMALVINENREAEVGVLKHKHHQFTLEIKKITLLGASVINHSTDLGEDLWIEAVNPADNGVKKYINSKLTFDRKTNRGDPEDFRWMVDLEGKEFHGSRLAITNPERFAPMIHLNSGIFYTQRRSQQMVKRVIQSNNVHEALLGKVASSVAAEIYLEGRDGEVVLRYGRKGSERVTFRPEPDTRYEIVLSNERPESMRTMGESDFVSWYEVFADQSGRRFDLRNLPQREPFNLRGIPSRYFLGSNVKIGGAVFGVPPQNCDPIYLRLAKKLKQLISG